MRSMPPIQENQKSHSCNQLYQLLEIPRDLTNTEQIWLILGETQQSGIFIYRQAYNYIFIYLYIFIFVIVYFNLRLIEDSANSGCSF